ncbi:MAG: glycosyltransferase family 39 protein, partial [bacterium]
MKSLLLTINRITLRMILSPVFVPLFLLLAAGLRIWWICTNDVWPVSDFEWYYQCATNLAHGVGYRYNGEVSAFFPPGYPVFLSLIIRLFGTSLFAIKCFSVLLQVSAVYLVYLLGRRLTSSEVAGRLAM